MFEAWGAPAGACAAPSGADAFVPGARERWVRAVEVAAPPALVWRWLCQLRAAPYSYDWIDNLGRRSPQQLTPGLEQVAVGQELLIAFRIVAVTPGRELVILADPRSGLLPPFAVAYAVEPAGTGTRLTAQVRVGAPTALPRLLARAALAALCAGDLVMMRRQLLNLKGLAERDAGGS